MLSTAEAPTPDAATMKRSMILMCEAGLLADMLCALIDDVAPGIEVHRSSERDPACLDAARVAAAALILVDVDHLVPGGDAALLQLTKDHPRVGVVAIGAAETSDRIGPLLAGGLRGYLPKSHGREAVLGVLRLLLAGAHYCPGSCARHGADAAPRVPWASVRMPSLARDFHLTPAEIAVLRLGAEGRTNREIGECRGRTEGVVRIQFNAIFRKLGVRNRAEATLVALRSEELLGVGWGAQLDLNNLLAHVIHRRCRAGETLFRRGDQGEEVFVVQRGVVRLLEVDAEMREHDVFGEIAAFSPGHRRTCTAVCTTDADLFVIPPEVARRVYCLDPRFAVYIRDLLTQRLTATMAVEADRSPLS